MPTIPDFSNASSVAGLGEMLNQYLAELTAYLAPAAPSAPAQTESAPAE